MVKVAGDTSTCPLPESVTMEQTVTERKRQGESPEKEISSMVAREETLSLHHPQAQDLYEEKRSHESLAEKRRKTRVKLELECAAAWRGGGHYG